MAEKSIPKVSVLVPIYNVEKYLRQCLISIVNQTLRDIEIICLNDGSTDSSGEIIQEFAKKDDRIVVIDKQNSGYGDSMNQGLKKARGEYIGIVESDDFVDLDAFEKLYSLAKTYNAEVVRANYYFNKNNKDEKNYYINPVDTGRVVNPERHTWIFYQAPAIWSAIYKRSFLKKNEIKFLPTPGASYQDTGFNFKVWASAHRAVFTSDAFLHYRIDNEASSVNNPKKVMNVCYEYEEIEKYLKAHDSFETFAPLMEATKFGAYFWNILRLKSNLLPDFLQRVKEEYVKARQEDLLIKEYFESPTQWKLLQFILNHSIGEAVLYIKLLKVKLAVRKKLKATLIALRPGYKKQKEIASLISELSATNDFLAAKLKLLEEQNNEKA